MNVSVVIPTHNRPEDLGAALRSLCAQSRPPVEIIVVDDGSDIAVSEDVFADFPAEITTKLLRINEPLGASNARNLGIKAASGDWIAFLDDDDRFERNKIETVVKTIAAHLDDDVIYHPAYICMVKEGVVYRTKPKSFEMGEDIFRSMLVKNQIGGTPMVTARRNSLIRSGMFDPQMPALQDYELWLRMARMDFRFRFIDLPLTTCNYTTSKKSISKSLEANKRALEIIESRYSDDYRGLSVNELNQHEEWKKQMIIHKSLLNGQVRIALREQLKQFAAKPHPKHLLGALAFFMGARITYRLRARFGR